LASGALLVRKRSASDEDCKGTTGDVMGGVEDGMPVEVEGVFLSDNEICADRVEHDLDFANAEEFEIVGIVTSVDEEAETFTLGDLNVVTDRSTEFDPRRLDPEVGRMLEVRGSLEEGTLSAREVAQEAIILLEGEVEELVNQGPDFMLLGIVIEVFSEGGTLIRDGPYGVGSSVEVKALRKATGGFSAVEVRVEDDALHRAQIQGRVDAVNVFENGVGSFRIEGILVSVDSSSECEDANGMVIDCDEFFEVLQVGDLVRAASGRNSPRFEDPANMVGFAG